MQSRNRRRFHFPKTDFQLDFESDFGLLVFSPLTCAGHIDAIMMLMRELIMLRHSWFHLRLRKGK